ncbi:MAG TPA: DUF805 domain-containing protein [Methylocystis sp.]|nr:DUF805 domain-containing protein [Methylocystis sp.]
MFDLLFSFKGRIGRLAYFSVLFGSTIFSILVALAVASVVGFPLPHTPVEYQAAMGALVLPLAPLRLLTMWITLAAGAKRLHDLGRSGWLQLWIGVALIVTLALAAVARAMQSGPFMILAGVLCLVVGLYAIWISIKMLFFPGDEGANDYGSPGGEDEESFASLLRAPRAVPAERTARIGVPAQAGFGRRR